MVNYPVGDFLIRIKNAALAGKRELEVPVSRTILAVARALERGGYLGEVETKGRLLRVVLVFRKKHPLLMDIKLVSRPGLRVYKTLDNLMSRRRPSSLLLSTPKGILLEKEALKEGLGGEVIAEVL